MTNEEIVYYILQHRYLEEHGLGELSDQEIIEKNSDIFPEDWFMNDYIIRNKILSMAIKNNLSLKKSYEQYMDSIESQNISIK